jgi:hypothetical protein
MIAAKTKAARVKKATGWLKPLAAAGNLAAAPPHNQKHGNNQSRDAHRQGFGYPHDCGPYQDRQRRFSRKGHAAGKRHDPENKVKHRPGGKKTDQGLGRGAAARADVFCKPAEETSGRDGSRHSNIRFAHNPSLPDFISQAALLISNSPR